MPRFRWAVPLVCCLLGGPALAQAPHSSTKKLYVERFAVKAGGEKLQEDLVAELRKLGSVLLVPDKSNADFLLDGGGEVYVKGYLSFSPRSHMKLPTNGMPIYGGYLSIELKNKEGVTVWSYLGTTSSEPENASKDLAKRVEKHLAEALSHVDTLSLPSRGKLSAVALSGAGATFPYPIYSKWSANFGAENPGVLITYDAIGSEAGIRKLLDGSVDFGASDSPGAIREIAPAEESKYLFFPSVLGAVVPIVNLPGLPDYIALTPEALAGIYLGRVKKWNDPVLKRANPRLNLPDLDIVVVHRMDGSGTSYAWTDYLSKTSAEWKSAVGASLAPKMAYRP